jgi:hypothetical protein
VALVLAIAVTSYQVQRVEASVQAQANENEGCERVNAYAADHQEVFYFLSIRSFSYCTRTFGIRGGEYPANYLFTGGWETYSPLTKEHLAGIGITDIQRDLVSRENTLIMIRPPDSIQYLVDYYHSIHLDVVASPVDTIQLGDQKPDVIVYRLQAAPPPIP